MFQGSPGQLARWRSSYRVLIVAPDTGHARTLIVIDPHRQLPAASTRMLCFPGRHPGRDPGKFT